MISLNKCIAAGLMMLATGFCVPTNVQAGEGSKAGPAPFSVFDMDGNGSVSEAEFYSVREQRMAAKASEGKKMRCAADAPSFTDLDTDDDGQLSPDELTAGQNAHRAKCQSMGQGSGHGAGHGAGMKGNMPAFSDFDLDADGVIVESEFNEAHAKRMSEMAAQGHVMKHAGDAPGFSGIDTNGDGGISEQEFSDHQAAHHKQMQENAPDQDKTD